jgi:endonuclease/exonuclease/phosphatase family metal-dependent hydrolase
VMSGSIPPEGYTYHSADLYQRIDYIWITPDLKAENAGVFQSTASDHLPVIVEIDK